MPPLPALGLLPIIYAPMFMGTYDSMYWFHMRRDNGYMKQLLLAGAPAATIFMGTYLVEVWGIIMFNAIILLFTGFVLGKPNFEGAWLPLLLTAFSFPLYYRWTYGLMPNYD